MHLDTRRCIAGQTTADGEEEEGIGRRMGGWGDGGMGGWGDGGMGGTGQGGLGGPVGPPVGSGGSY